MINKPPSTTKSPSSGKSGFALSLKGRALRLLSGREQSRAELERKLGSHEEEPGQLAAVLDELQAKDFISPTRVIESVINRRQAKMGASRIKGELQRKGLDADKVAEAMDGLNEREKHILMERRLVDEPKTLEELSQRYSVSRERVRQIEVRAFEKLQKAMLRIAGDKRMLTAY